MDEAALDLYRRLRKRITAYYDEKAAIGRRYRRQDEAGTPFCVTVDGETLSDGTVTVRDRDTCAQTRVAADRLLEYLEERIGAEG
jgi:glycyl-tRNA synthetase